MKPTVLRIALVALLLIVQLATVVIVVLGMRNQTDTQFAQIAESGLNDLVTRAQERTDAVTVPAQTVIASTRELIIGGLLDAGSNQALETYFLSQLRSSPQLGSLRFGRDDGSMVQVTRDDEGYLSRVVSVADITKPGLAVPAASVTPRALATISRLSARTAALSRFDPDLRRLRSWVDPKDVSDPRRLNWYEMARRTPQIVWTGVGPYLATNESGLVVAGTTNNPDTTDAGVIAADVALTDVNGALAQLALPDEGSLALTDDRGRAIAFIDSSSGLQRSLVSAQLTPIESTIGQPLRSLLVNLNIPLIAEGSPLPRWRKNKGFTGFPVNGQEHYGLATPLSVGNASVSWLLSLQAPAQSFSGSLGELFSRKMRTLLAVILIPALIAVLALFGLTEPKVRREEESTTDELTGFLTRDEFHRRLDGMLLNRRELEYGGRIVVVALEMDGFNTVELRYGQETGNTILRQFARRLRARVRQHDLLGRTGPDEFVIALRVDRDADVLTTVNRIRRATVIKPFSTRSGRHLLGVTAGIACVDPNEGVDDLIGRADQALVTGKARNKNRSYLAPERDSTWPQTGVALPEADQEEDTIPREDAPTLVI